jgi:hypothetical protein
LIQNAEDNNYTRAAQSRADPYIKFDIYPDKIIVDNNEDGFTAANVESICKIADSTKTRTDSQYYIGEKGIGFKSVFMVASKVHIQSGPFSFFFEHPSPHGDSGMGMITPVYCPPDEALQDPLTRITLTLRDGLSFQDLEDLDRQFFRDLPDALLLFLTKLKRITINKYDASKSLLTHTTYTSHRDQRNHRATLLKVTQHDGKPPETWSTRYQIARKILRNLPHNDKRDHNTTEVALAFPIDGDDTPIIEQQDVYAYLPINNFGFSVRQGLPERFPIANCSVFNPIRLCLTSEPTRHRGY